MEFHLFIQLFLLLCNKPFQPFRPFQKCRFSTKQKQLKNKTLSIPLLPIPSSPIPSSPVPSSPVPSSEPLPPVHEFPVVDSKWDCGEVPF